MKINSALLGLAVTCAGATAHADYWHEPPRGQRVQLEYDAGAAYLSG